MSATRAEDIESTVKRFKESLEGTVERLEDYLDEIVKDYRWAEDIAYGTRSGSGESTGKGTGIVAGHSDPTGETATSPEAMRYTCTYISHALERMMRQADKLAADLDSRLRQHDDPHARAMRKELAEEARTVTKQDRRAMQDQRDRDMNKEMQGDSTHRLREAVNASYRRLGRHVAAT